MDVKITFHNMPHSAPLEEHAREKLGKLETILKAQSHASPFFVELWLKANKQHPHHAAELHVRTALFNLHTHNEGADMYVVVDSVIDKMVVLTKKEKDRHMDKTHKPDTDKKKFSR